MSDLKNKDFLFSMLKIASPSGEEIGLQKYLIEAMKDVDDKVYTHHNMNVVHAINPDSKMKVLLYTEFENKIGKSGLGKAIKHQMRALEDNNVPYTTNKKDNYDIVHINFYGPKSYRI